MIWSKRETVEALRRIAAIAEDGSHVAPDEYREQFAELRLDVNAILALNEERAAEALRIKREMVQEAFLRAVGEGWTKFYFWLDPEKPDDKVIAMKCGPVAPEGVEHEVYDVAAIEAAIDNKRDALAGKAKT